MDRSTENRGDGPRPENEGAALDGGRGRPGKAVPPARPRWFGIGIAAGVVVIGALALALTRPDAIDAAAPVPGPSATTSASTGLPQTSPTTRPHVALTGGHMFRDVMYDLPSPAWKVQKSAFDPRYVRFVGPADNNVSVLVYPGLAAFPTSDATLGDEMLAPLRDLADVRVLGSGTTTRGNHAFAWMDLAVASDADLATSCLDGSPCLPLVTAGSLETPVLELRPGQVSRLFVEDRVNVQMAFWVQDVEGPGAAEALRLADGLTFTRAYE